MSKNGSDNPVMARSLSPLPSESTAGPSYNKAYDDTNDKKASIHHRTQRDLTPQANEKNTWDAFAEETIEKVLSSDEQFWERIYIAAKICFTLVVFVLVLGSAFISKGALFLIIANVMQPNNEWNSSLKTAKYHFQYKHTETNVTWIWSLVLIVITPYILTVLVSIWNILLKTMEPIPNKTTILLVLMVETVHSVGLCLFVFVVLPNVDPISGAIICMNMAALPSCLSFIFPGAAYSYKIGVTTDDNSHDKTDDKTDDKAYHKTDVTTENSKQIRHNISKIMTFASLLASISSTVFWCYYVSKLNLETGKESTVFMIAVTCSPLLISVTWWTTFVPQGNGKDESRWLPKLKYQIRECRPKVAAIIYSWKVIITVGITIALYSVDCEDSSSCLQTLFKVSNYTQNSAVLSTIFGRTHLVEDTDMGLCSTYLPLYIALVNIGGSIVCHRCCAVALEILAQIQGFSIPLVLVTPSVIACMFVVMVILKHEIIVYDGCYLPFPRWFGDVEFDWTMLVAGISGYVSIVMVTWYIWEPRKERMQKADRYFTQPFYCGVLLEQSLLLNRTKHVEDYGYYEAQNQTDINNGASRGGEIPFIYMCATMWHETQLEMKQLLMSIMRVDLDQCSRKIYMGREKDPDHYEFEAHIFLDDAYVYKNDEIHVNTYVKELIQTVNVAKSTIHTKAVADIPPPIHKVTPYGARLTWTLPGKNVLIAHLKDRDKIRHKKRWSQIMYIYYFLTYKMKLTAKESDRAKEKKLTMQERAQNVFLLALDGDVDFQPFALKLLIDKMKKNPKVGAACGRIHPIGTGPMVWYQKFEYAVSHWLQKSTEHITGCVLCSPGCFSLFRGLALMDTNVTRRYTTPPSEARHHVQYDQGEDRWLCTLLLQRGWRVEYCAASDALTFAPEGFNEFYNQRRRWTPSTMANVMDLLMDSKNVRKNNNDISLVFIAYQFLLMISSILTPGTIFLMIVGAINMAYPTLSLTLSLVLNVVPVAVFILLCFVAQKRIQLMFAAILSTAYSLLMMLVIVGLLRQVIEYGLCSVTTVFFCFVGGVFLVSAFLHPQEFWCIVHGFLYFIAIPSMSMLLMVYSLCNLHDVSWGTRETPAAAVQTFKSNETVKETRQQKKSVQEWMNQLGGSSDYSFSFGNLFRCICCPKERKANEDIKLHEVIIDRFEKDEERLNTTPSSQQEHFKEQRVISTGNVTFLPTSGPFETSNEKKSTAYIEETKTEIYPWKSDDTDLDGTEKVFWEELIKTYLLPYERNEDQEEKMKEDLVELRNKACVFFILVNALFITIIFSLQQVNADSGGTISIKLSCANDGNGEAIEPISIAFTLVFGILLLIQFIGMLYHRMSTFLHVCSVTGWTPTQKVNFSDMIQKMQERTQAENTGQQKRRQLADIMHTHLWDIAQQLKYRSEDKVGGKTVAAHLAMSTKNTNLFKKTTARLVESIKLDKGFAQTLIKREEERREEVKRKWKDACRKVLKTSRKKVKSTDGMSEDKPRKKKKKKSKRKMSNIDEANTIPEDVNVQQIDSEI